MELLEINIPTATGNQIKCILRKMWMECTPDPAKPESLSKQIVVQFDEVHDGADGSFTIPLTMIADNTTNVPVFKQLADGTLEPVLIESGVAEGESGYFEPYQKNIGEFDMWKVLVFENNFVSLNNAFTQGVMRKKGLTTEPLAFIDPFA